MTDGVNHHVRFLALVGREWKTVPNMLTALRAVLSVLTFYLLVVHSGWAPWVYAVTASTDWVDGWYARHYHQETFLGKMMDPIVDKLLIAAAGIGTCIMRPEPKVLVAVGMILLREACVATLVEVYRRNSLMLSVTWEGKVKTALQGAAFFLLMLHPTGDLAQVADLILVVAATVTVMSGIDYFMRARALSRPVPAVLPGE
jgi:CDP-diacylglycerol--glycerol-3-phosphate 3-phosphatidyltransferase